jgi:methylated-DNA-[protein]-cysteine S-methyltransferase
MPNERVAKFDSDQVSEEILDKLLHRSRPRINEALRSIRRPEAALGIAKSPLGDLLVALGRGGLLLVHYLPSDKELAALITRLRSFFDPVEDRQAVQTVGAEVKEYLAGEGASLRQKVDLSLVATAFQKRVLHKLQEVPRGAVVSYQALGALAGAPKGARAIGNAMHNNPVPIYVPCHRVIAADGRLGGYGGGRARKLQLLRSEGFALGKADEKLPDGVIWGHKGTRIFCRTNCHTTARVDRTKIMFFADPGEAKQAGLRPCKICRPS